MFTVSIDCHILVFGRRLNTFHSRKRSGCLEVSFKWTSEHGSPFLKIFYVLLFNLDFFDNK